MRRRDFLALSSFLPLFARQILAGEVSKRPATFEGPSLLLSPRDPFCGLDQLKARYNRGVHPPDDAPGLALSWRLIGDGQFATRAIELLRKTPLPSADHPGRTWIDFVALALASDWLRGFPAFEQELHTRIALRLVEGAERVLRLPDLADPAQTSYHNYSLRYLACAAFALAGAAANPQTAQRAAALLPHVDAAFRNVLELTELVTPEGSYHESLDYSRITWVPLALLAELWRTTTGFDPAARFNLFKSFGQHYLYKLMPDGTPSREGDNEYPILDDGDTSVLGYAVHRFKDSYAAWVLRESGYVPTRWRLPVLSFLWNDDQVVPRDPALAPENELPRQKYFPGVGHLVMRTGWDPNATWIEFDCGPYFSKHQHLDQNHFTIYHKGYLAIDSGADYTDTESPHYLNYYRRTVAHNTLLVYDPEERFFWSENVLPAANDGGQRMDSSRFWNSVRSLRDWENTRDLWDLARMRVVDHLPGRYHYAFGDASHAYSRAKLALFTRELLFDPRLNLLYVFDRVRAEKPGLHKAWLLHGIGMPEVEGTGVAEGNGATSFKNTSSFRLREGEGELLVHALLPRDRIVTRRGGPGYEFWTPGDEHGGPWGSGENWPMEPEGGTPLPTDARLRNMWKKFWGADFVRIQPSNYKGVKPGTWRIEVAPSSPSLDDVFLHVLEIGSRGLVGKEITLLEGLNVAGALAADGSGTLFSSTQPPLREAEVTLPDAPCDSLVVTGLEADTAYEAHLSGPNTASSPGAASPGVPLRAMSFRSNPKGVAALSLGNPGNVRLRISRQ